MPIAHKNHYVPCVYLKHFADSMGSVSVYRLLVSSPRVRVWKRASVSAVGYYLDLYTKSMLGSEADEIERWLGREFETPAQPVLGRVRANDEMHAGDWEILVRFLACQIVRTPAFFIGMLPIWNRMMPAVLKSTFEHVRGELERAKLTGGRPPLTDSSEFKEEFPLRVKREDIPERGVATITAEVLVGRQLWISSMRRMLTSTVRVLHTHSWSVFHAGGDRPFFTSDDPVVRLNYHSASRYDFGGGWGSRGTEIFLPLSPRHLMYTKIGERFPARGLILSADETHRFRRIIAEHAHRQIFASGEDPDAPIFRPRTVSASAVKNENEQWKKWHEDQSRAELELLADAEVQGR